MIHKKVTMLQNEVWYGPSSKHGELMPHNRKTVYSVNIETNATCNQDNPLLISNMGRFIYAPRGFSLDISGGVISAVSKFGEIDFAEGFGTLRGAYLEACRRYFPPSGSTKLSGTSRIITALTTPSWCISATYAARSRKTRKIRSS